MPRRKKPLKRIPLADPVYNNVEVAKFINRLMRRGKKGLAEKIFYATMENIKAKTNEEPLEIFQKAIKNAKPLVQVKARRIGGSTYQVPVEVSEDRGWALAATWIIAFAKGRSGKSMVEKLTNEIMDASNATGSSVKKREDTHKMAEANKAFAHYRY